MTSNNPLKWRDHHSLIILVTSKMLHGDFVHHLVVGQERWDLVLTATWLYLVAHVSLFSLSHAWWPSGICVGKAQWLIADAVPCTGSQLWVLSLSHWVIESLNPWVIESLSHWVIKSLNHWVIDVRGSFLVLCHAIIRKLFLVPHSKYNVCFFFLLPCEQVCKACVEKGDWPWPDNWELLRTVFLTDRVNCLAQISTEDCLQEPLKLFVVVLSIKYWEASWGLLWWVN